MSVLLRQEHIQSNIIICFNTGKKGPVALEVLEGLRKVFMVRSVRRKIPGPEGAIWNVSWRFVEV